MDFSLENVGGYQKCGDILLSLSKEQQHIYAIKCIFCPQLKESFADFIQHIEYQHRELFNALLDLCENQENIGCSANDNEIVNSYAELHTEEIKIEYHQESDVDDPLCDQPKQRSEAGTSSTNQSEKYVLDINFSEMKKEEVSMNDFVLESETNCIEVMSSSLQENEHDCKKHKQLKPQKTVTKQQSERINEIYKTFPCLWNSEHIDFRFKNQKQKAIKDMLKIVNEQLQMKFTTTTLEEHLSRLRQAFSREKRMQLQCEGNRKPQEKTMKLFTTLSFLNEHIGPFKCEECSKMFTSCDLYKMHKAEHDGTMPFICPICKRGFTRAGNLSMHVRRHTHNYDYECDVCKKRFAAHQEMVKHKRLHTGEKPYLCNTCGKAFRAWSFFDRHIRRHQKRPQHFCDICKKGFYEKSKLDDHIKAHYNIRDKICNICGKAFTCNKYLIQHKQIHSDKKNYVCTICNREFAQYAGLSGHMKSHGTAIANNTTI